MDSVPDILEDDVFYSVLDYSSTQRDDVDFVFMPLIFLDVFPRPAADLRVGKYRIQLPLDWSIIIADKNFGHMEIIELKHLNDRDFDAFVFNPIRGYMPGFEPLSIVNIYADRSWVVPKLKYGHILTVPLVENGAVVENPDCIFAVKDVQKLPESLDITKIFT